jgi:hypothetical protein
MPHSKRNSLASDAMSLAERPAIVATIADPAGAG